MPKVATAKKQKKERLPDNERIVLTIGLGLTVVFTLVFGLMMFALSRSGLSLIHIYQIRHHFQAREESHSSWAGGENLFGDDHPPSFRNSAFAVSDSL